MTETTIYKGYEVFTEDDPYYPLEAKTAEENMAYPAGVKISYKWKSVRIPAELVPGLAKWLLEVYGDE